MKADIKIFMCVHKPFSFVPPLSEAVHGGSAIFDPIPGAKSDYGEGGSISEKNPDYCERTVQYYAWKNEAADYYGFCHYRRFFAKNKKGARPYLVMKKPDSEKLSGLLLSEEEIRELCESYDVIVPEAENMGCSVYKQYCASDLCKEDDLLLFENLICKKYPYLAAYAKKYLSNTKQYFCNMFIMKRDLFFDYCEHLFPLLEEFDKRKSAEENANPSRTDGFLAERFLGIYILYLYSKGTKIYECKRMDVGSSLSKRLAYRFFPPESKRRFLIKRFIKKI